MDTTSPFLVSLDRARELLDMSRSELYLEIGRGRLVALKDGRRCKITMESIPPSVAELPRADIKPAAVDTPATRIA